MNVQNNIAIHVTMTDPNMELCHLKKVPDTDYGSI